MSCIKSIQRGYFTTADDRALQTKDVTINTVDASKSVVLVDCALKSTVDLTHQAHAVLLSISNNSFRLHIQGSYTELSYVSWQVIEFA